MVDRYTKTVLTIIAAALVWMVIQQLIPLADAASTVPQPVFVAQISKNAAECIAGYGTFFHGDTGPCIVGW